MGLPELAAGRPFPLGATLTETGVNFAVVADGDHVDLCLIDDDGSETRVPITHRTGRIWHAHVAGVRPGQHYGYRVAATDPAKVLLDPYARRITGIEYDLSAASTPGTDTLGRVPIGIVAEPVAATEPLPHIPWGRTVIYEAHVTGLTRRHPAVPPHERGTFAGLAHPAVIEHLASIGVTAVELLPVHAHTAEPLLAAADLKNYWGYSTLNYFSVHPEYASRPGAEMTEFAAMVDALHRAGLEVLLDVVFNHTCEGGPDTPITLSWRGLAPGTYYLPAGTDLTGTGSTVNTASLTSTRMIVDSLRYFAEQFAIDGFRFDLAPVLGRPGGHHFDPAAPLLTAIAADPVLRTRKLVAEPWDATGAGYSLGRFGPDWSEWNDRYRGTVRDFWRGRPGVRQLAYRLAGSEDVFASRGPWASVNFVTAHDGFTLRDVVSYERKHNQANGQGGHDGTDDNRSANYGVEGDGSPAAPLDPAIAAVRTRQARNLAATLMLSTGTPMLCAGDEMWRTQAGNNNAFVIDSPQSWLDWAALDEPDSAASDMLAFFRRLTGLRATEPALRQSDFFSGRAPAGGDGVPDIIWFSPGGHPMTDADWFDAGRQTLLMWVDGADVIPSENPAADVASWMVVAHAGVADLPVTLPGAPYGEHFTVALDTASPTGEPTRREPIPAGSTITIPGRTLLLLRAHR